MIRPPEPNAAEREISRLAHELSRVMQENSLLKEDLRTEREKTRSVLIAVESLRRQLEPQYIALQGLFGDIELLSDGSASDGGGQTLPDAKRKIWLDWQEKLGRGTGEARAIEALLTHGSMTTAQIRLAIKVATRTASNVVTKLKGLGLIVRTSDGRYSLKEL